MPSPSHAISMMREWSSGERVMKLGPGVTPEAKQLPWYRTVRRNGVEPLWCLVVLEEGEVAPFLLDSVRVCRGLSLSCAGS
jgi:hypothetical protein